MKSKEKSNARTTFQEKDNPIFQPEKKEEAGNNKRRLDGREMQKKKKNQEEVFPSFQILRTARARLGKFKK